MKTALITGITGQDGSYLAEFLLSKGYVVHGIIRRASTFNTGRIDHLISDKHDPNAKLFLHYGDLTEGSQVANLIQTIKPDEIYNLGAQSHVRVSFDSPEYTGEVTGIGVTRILYSILKSDLKSKIRFYQASSSEMFGRSPAPQSENTKFQPCSPYACAKVYAYWMTKNYREGNGVFACNGILFNHESPRRGETFVTRKITRAIANILAGKQKYLYLGNLAAKRDWGYSPEYVEFMWKMLQSDTPDDFVIGTGETHSVKEFVDEAFKYAGLKQEDHVKIDSAYFRPVEVEQLIADPSKAKHKLNFDPKIKFKDLVKIMVDADMRAIGLKSIGEGDAILKEKFPQRWWKID